MTKGSTKNASTAIRARRRAPLPVPTDVEIPEYVGRNRHDGIGYDGAEEAEFKPGQSVKQWLIGAIIVLLLILAVLYIGPDVLSGGMLGSGAQ